MASSHSSAKNDGKGAAEEPDSESEGSLPSSTTTTAYDPTVFQRPHPDDRGGGGNGKPRKSDGGEGKPTNDGKATAKDGKGGLSLDRCGNCGAEGELRKCKQCGAVAYCGEACQTVSVP